MKNYSKHGFKLYLLVSLLLSPLFGQASSSTLFERNVAKALEQEQLAGIVWATESQGKQLIGSAGYSNRQLRSVMAESQKVQVGSVTKSVLAVGVMRLITQGALSLDTNVESLLPNLKFRSPWRNRNPITVKNLLDHTAGLDNIRMWQFLSTKPTPNSALNDAFPSDNNQLLWLRSKPGTQYSYSNMGYTLLGMVIEAVTNQRYEAYLDNNLLAPLGMFNSTFEYVSQTGIDADPELAMGYLEDNVEQDSIPMVLRPAGQFTTTATDMAAFMKFLLNNGVLNGKAFVNAELMNLLSYPQGTDAHKAGLTIGHGLALAMRDRHNVLGMCHPGTGFGFRAYICLFPEQEKAFFYAINTDNDSADYERFNKLFINALAIKKIPIESPRSSAMNTRQLVGAYIPSPNNMAEFEWLDLLFNFKWLRLNQGNLVLSSLQSNDRTLIPLNNSLLRATDRRTASHAIVIDESEDIFISDGLNTYKKHSWLTIIAYWLSLIFGIFGLLYIFVVGFFRTLSRDSSTPKFIVWPFANILAFAVPIALYFNQSFLRFGELTLASLLLAIVSGLLPASLLLALIVGLQAPKSGPVKRDSIAALMLFQLCVVFLSWNVFPIVFWK